MSNILKEKPEYAAEARSARLSAVQAIYQISFNQQPIRGVVREYMDHRSEMEIDGEKLVSPDLIRFKTIVLGVEERLPEIEAILQAHIKNSDSEQERVVEPLLRAIFLCGIYEILTCQDIDFPIIINDYLFVTHAFYDQSQAGFVNAVLDAVAKLVRV